MTFDEAVAASKQVQPGESVVVHAIQRIDAHGSWGVIVRVPGDKFPVMAESRADLERIRDKYSAHKMVEAKAAKVAAADSVVPEKAAEPAIAKNSQFTLF